MKRLYIYVAALAVGMVSCEPELDDSVEDRDIYTNGEVDFSNYVAVGNSLTAGYADNALYRSGQINSFPNILAEKFAAVQETGEFRQPLVDDNTGGLLLGGQQIQPNRLVLFTDENGENVPLVYTGKQPGTEVTNKLTGPFNNLGAPGAKSYHLVAQGYGNAAGIASGTANPYYARFSSSESSTILEDALAQNPTFFTLWIGNNDVLGFASSGGSGVDQTGNLNPLTYGSNDITDPQVFAQVYSQVATALAENASGGVLLNIPSVTSAAYFNTVPANAVPLDAATAQALNTQFAAYNSQILPGLVGAGVISAEEAAARQINFAAGQNFVSLVDEDLTNISQIIQGPPFNVPAQTAATLGQLRQATAQDLVTLPSSSFIGTVVGGNAQLINGVSVPLGDQYVLTTSEQELVAAATVQYNQVIAQVAQANGLALVDVNSLLNQLQNGGIPYDAGTISSTFGTGGAFSLDGIHLTARGYAVIANAIIEATNATYGSTVPMANPGEYGTVFFSQDVQ